MSRIGNLPIVLPAGVEFSIDADQNITVKGPLGSMNLSVDTIIKVEKKENEIVLSRNSNAKEARSKHGLYRALLANLVIGVTKGFDKTLIVKGVGFRSAVAGQKLTLNIGFSHPVVIEAPQGIKLEIVKANEVKVSGISKELVGQFAAKIRDIKPVEPYHAYGIRYSDEKVRRKEGKTAGK